MGKREARGRITEVGEQQRIFIAKFRLRDLRRALNVELAKRGEHHADAARRAGVTPTWWSRLVNSRQLTEHDLAVLAKGVRCSAAELIKVAQYVEPVEPAA